MSAPLKKATPSGRLGPGCPTFKLTQASSTGRSGSDLWPPAGIPSRDGHRALPLHLVFELELHHVHVFAHMLRRMAVDAARLVH